MTIISDMFAVYGLIISPFERRYRFRLILNQPIALTKLHNTITQNKRGKSSSISSWDQRRQRRGRYLIKGREEQRKSRQGKGGDVI